MRRVIHIALASLMLLSLTACVTSPHHRSDYVERGYGPYYETRHEYRYVPLHDSGYGHGHGYGPRNVHRNVPRNEPKYAAPHGASTRHGYGDGALIPFEQDLLPGGKGSSGSGRPRR